MGENESNFVNAVSGSPSTQEKQYTLRLSYECTDHRANSYENDKEKFAFTCKVEDLVHRLLRFTPSEIRKELEKEYKALEEEIIKIEESKLDPNKKKKEILDKQYDLAVKIHRHNLKLIPNTSIIDKDVEGELDISDEEIMEIIRGGKRTDDTGLRLHR